MCLPRGKTCIINRRLRLQMWPCHNRASSAPRRETSRGRRAPRGRTPGPHKDRIEGRRRAHRGESPGWEQLEGEPGSACKQQHIVNLIRCRGRGARPGRRRMDGQTGACGAQGEPGGGAARSAGARCRPPACGHRSPKRVRSWGRQKGGMHSRGKEAFSFFCGDEGGA